MDLAVPIEYMSWLCGLSGLSYSPTRNIIIPHVVHIVSTAAMETLLYNPRARKSTSNGG